MSRIKVINHNEATGELLEIYEQLLKTRGKLAEVHTIQSLRPRSIVKHMELYLEIMFSKSELSRAEREMIAVVVSAANCCEYCQIHHAEALNHYWKDDEKVSQLRGDFQSADLTPKQLMLCLYAEELTLNPGKSKKCDNTEALRKVGLNDSAILDVTLVVSYFNFVNRIVLALDVGIEENGAAGFNY